MTDSSAELHPNNGDVNLQFRPETHRYIRIDLEDVDRIIDSDLSASGIKIFLSIASLDRFGDQGIRTQPIFLRKRLGKNGKALSKSTFYEEKAKLQKLGLVDFSETDVKVRNCTGYKAPERLLRQCETPPVETKCKSSPKKQTKTEIPNLKLSKPDLEDVSPDSESGKTNPKTSESLLGEDATTSKRSQELCHSLSHQGVTGKEEREERLIEFIISQNPEVKNPRAYARVCLEKDRDYWEQQFSSSTAALDWEANPLLEVYLSALRTEGRSWIATCTDSAEKRKRLSFLDWAQKEGLV